MKDVLFWADAVRYRSRIVAATFVVVVVAVTAYAMLMPSSYAAEARLLFDRDPPNLTGPDRVNAPSPESAAAAQQTRANVILSRTVATEVARGLNLSAHPAVREAWRKDSGGRVDFDTWVVEWLRRQTTVDAPRTSDTAVVHVVAPDARLAADIANGVANGFITTQSRLRTQPAQAYTRWLTTRTAEARGQLGEVEARLAQFKRANGLVNGADLSPDVDRLQELSTQLAIAEAEAVGLGARAGRNSAASPEVQGTAVIQTLRESIAAKAADVTRIGERYGADHPTRRQAQSELDQLRASLSSETSTASRSLNVSRDAADAKRTGLRRLVGQQRDRMIAMSSNFSRLALLQADTDRAQRNYDQLSARLTQMQLQSAVPTTDVRLLDSASVPLERSSPRRGLIVALGMLLGLILGAVLAIIAEYLDPRVRSIAALERIPGARVVGAVPIEDRRRLVPVTMGA